MDDSNEFGLLDAEQAAGVLGISERYLRQLGRDGKIASVRIGGCVRFELEDLRAWVKANRQEAKPQPKRSDHLREIARLATELLRNEVLQSSAALMDGLRKEVERLTRDRQADADVMAQKDKLILDLKDKIATLGANLSSAEEKIDNLRAQLQRQEEEHFAQVGKLKAQRMASEGRQTAQERRRGLSKPMAGEGGDAPYRGVADNAK